MGWLRGGDLGGSQGGDSKYPKKTYIRGKDGKTREVPQRQNNPLRKSPRLSAASKKGWGSRGQAKGSKGGAAGGLDRWG